MIVWKARFNLVADNPDRTGIPGGITQAEQASHSAVNDNFAEVVGARYILKKFSTRNFVPCSLFFVVYK